MTNQEVEALKQDVVSQLHERTAKRYYLNKELEKVDEEIKRLEGAAEAFQQQIKLIESKEVGDSNGNNN